MIKFKFPTKCPNCNAKLVGGSDKCSLYECGGKVSITGEYGDVLTFVFKNCLAEVKGKINDRIKKKEDKTEEK